MSPAEMVPSGPGAGAALYLQQLENISLKARVWEQISFLFSSVFSLGQGM